MMLLLLPGALQLEEVYTEIARVLKPGGLFASYEWVATKKYDPKNARHVQIIDEINFGNGLPVRPACERLDILQVLARCA